MVDYGVGLALQREQRPSKRKFFLLVSIFVNIGLLGFFKYYNFFLDSFVDAFSLFGSSFTANRLSIILPVGISFYTFQTLSYTIDVYRRKMQPTKDFVAFTAFVSFFPQLVAGPIERATNLLPQFFKKRTFHKDQAVIGIKQIIWGLFKKLVIADNCAQYANEIFDNYQSYSSLTLVLGAVYFAFQVYGDFSGYSDIAIGTARLFNFKLSVNFKYPYFSRSMAEFWRRWHISLMTWFRDYVYIPLGGSRHGKLLQARNVMVVFILCGFWHGASWNFIVWGVLYGLFFLPSIFRKTEIHSFKNVNPKSLPGFRDFAEMTLVFSGIAFGLIFFRTATISEAISYIEKILEFSAYQGMLGIYRYAFELLPLLLLLLWWEWYNRNKEFPLFSPKPEFFRTGLVILFIVFLGNFEELKQFFYFKF